ncbi:MAG: ribbon-helix-helix protein, CopG family [Firmicutes bacterium]|nr:ribbon-helix-helix protein, CopG family [Bacillota bacterium]
MPTKNIVPTSIRLKKELMDKIKEDADKQKRSITKQIEYIIENYYNLKED